MLESLLFRAGSMSQYCDAGAVAEERLIIKGVVMPNTKAMRLSETLQRAQAITDGLRGQNAQRVREYLAESERRLPEWMRERYRQMDEALAERRMRENLPAVIALTGVLGTAALMNTAAADQGAYGKGAQDAVRPVTTPVKKYLNKKYNDLAHQKHCGKSITFPGHTCNHTPTKLFKDVD